MITFLFCCSKKYIRQTVVREICALSTGNLPFVNLSSNSLARITDRPYITLVVDCERKVIIKKTQLNRLDNNNNSNNNNSNNNNNRKKTNRLLAQELLKVGSLGGHVLIFHSHYLTKGFSTIVKARLRYTIMQMLYGQVHVGNDQEKAQSEINSHSKNLSGKNTSLTIRYL